MTTLWFQYSVSSCRRQHRAASVTVHTEVSPIGSVSAHFQSLTAHMQYMIFYVNSRYEIKDRRTQSSLMFHFSNNLETCVWLDPLFLNLSIFVLDSQTLRSLQATRAAPKSHKQALSSSDYTGNFNVLLCSFQRQKKNT